MYTSSCKKMHKLIVILVILYVLMLQQVKAKRKHDGDIDYTELKINDTSEKPKYTQEIDLVINEDIQSFTLFRNDSHIFINSSDRYFKPCVIEFERLGYGFEVAPFNQKIILWDRETDKEKKYRVTGTILLLTDPLACNITSKIKLPIDFIPEYQPPNKAQVVTYKGLDYFDIFFGGRTACMPCRFSSQGEKVTIEYQLQNITTRAAGPYLIRPLREFNPNFGYFYAHTFYNGSVWTQMNLLHFNFSLIRQIHVNHRIDAVAIDDTYRDIVVCYKKEHQKYIQVTREDQRKSWGMMEETEVYCDVYNKNLELENHIKLSVPSDHYVNKILLSIGRGATLCVAVPHISYSMKNNMYSLSFFRFNSLDRSNMESFGSLGSIYKNFDDEDGFNLKMRSLRMLHMHCP